MLTIAENRYKRKVIKNLQEAVRIVQGERSSRAMQMIGKSIQAVCGSIGSSSRLEEIN